MRVLDIDDITSSYALTLRRWRENWLAAADEAERLGADRGFRRLLELYFSWSEGGFIERRIQDVQVLFAKPAYRGSRVNTLRDEAPIGA
jgi:cyclopropane-fatty-acyl-phospholipid synthase